MWGLELLPDVQQALETATVKMAVPWAAIAMALSTAFQAWSSSRQGGNEDDREDQRRREEYERAQNLRGSRRGVLQPMWERHGLPARSDEDWDKWTKTPAPQSLPRQGFDWQGLIGGLMGGAGQGLAASEWGQEAPQQSGPGQGPPEIPADIWDWLRYESDPSRRA